VVGIHVTSLPLLISQIRENVKLFFNLGAVEVVLDWLTPDARNWLVLVTFGVDIPNVDIHSVFVKSRQSIFATLGQVMLANYWNIAEVASLVSEIIEFIID
jgi:hypothetical protein